MVDNMEWFNVFGLIFIAVIMIPNVVFAIKCKDGFDNKWNNKYIEVTEQVGRLGCFGFMIINIPGTWFGWWSDEAFALYLIVDTILVMLYCAIWIICFKKNSVFRALALSIIPSMLFLFSGIMSRSVLLIIASVLFAPSHIMISHKSTRHFPACSHNFPKAGEARFQGRSRLFRLLGKLPYLGESRRILMAVSSKTSSKTRFCYAATRRISSAAVQPSIWA